jgi:uncharacterized protein YjeT (DUF2065 family)
MEKLAQTDAKLLRVGGLISVIAGLVLLWVARNG